MTPAEVVDVLSKCAAYDQRTVGEVDVMAWHEILARVELADALDAVRRHYGESRDRAMPADILKLSRIARDDRQRIERRAEIRALPSRFEPDEIRDERVRRGVAAVIEALPAIDPSERIHQLATRRARIEHGPLSPPERTRKAKRKPKPEPPVTGEVAGLASRYLADGHDPADVAERFGVAKWWCDQTRREVQHRRGEWCGECAYETRQRWKNGLMVDCPRCKPDTEGEQ
jgi:hypothetical protein